MSRLGPERPGLGCSLEVRAGDEEELRVGSLAGADPRPLLRRQGASPAHPDPCHLSFWQRRGHLGKEAPSCWLRRASLFCRGTRRPEPSRHVLPGPCAGRRAPSSAAVPDTSFLTTCFAEVFRSLLQLFPLWGPPSTLGPAQGPLEGTPGAPHILLEIYLFFLEVTHYCLQSVQIALVSRQL